MNQHFNFHTRLRLAFGLATIMIAALIAANWYAVSRVREAVLFVALLALLAFTYAMARRQLAERKQAEAVLRDSTARIESILDTVVDGIITIDARGLVQAINPAAERIFGYSAAEVIGQNVKMLMPEPYQSEHDGYLQRYQTTGEAHIIGIGREVVGRRKDGSTFAMELAVSEMRMGSERHYTGIVRDITERKQAEAALRDSEESLSTTLHSIADAVLATDTAGRIVRMNPVAERLTGWPFTDAKGQPIGQVFRIIHEQTRAPAEVPVAKVLATGEACDLASHALLIARDGTEWPIADSAAPIRDADGQVTGVVLVFRDVSVERAAKRQIEEQNAWLEERVRERTAQLRESEAQLKTVLENLDEGVTVFGLDGQILQFNRAAIELHGFISAEEYLCRLPELVDTFELSSLDGTRLVVDQWPLARVLRGEALHELDVAVRHLGQLWQKTFQYNGTLVRDAGGQPLLAVLTIRDITERKRAEQEILDLNASLEQRVAERTQQAEEANRAKSDFLANMSHELRTPLNSIIGGSEMLKDGVLGKLEAKQQGFVTDIFDAGSHLLSLINDILDLSKVEAGMLQLEARAVDIAALLKASMLIVREKALAHRIRLDTQLDASLGTLQADERKLKQIVYNLLSNAVKFSPEGGTVTLSARRCTRAEVALDAAMPGRLVELPPGADSEFLAITVENSGEGIAEEHLAKLFEPFTQVDSSVARRYAGTGLGLSLVRRLAELHGGTVGVASSPGAGSRFCVWLPYREAASAVQEDVMASVVSLARPVAMDAAAPAVPLALVIDDDDGMADQIATQLRAEGFAVMRAATAEEGLVCAARHRPQLITLDIFLPHMDGLEFLQHLRADPGLAATPVVIISVSGDLDCGITLGARRVLQKPFTRNELVATLTGLVAARPGGEAALVLVVDDNVKAVELLATLLKAEGYGVLCAYGGAEAIEVAKRALPDLVILDLMMPEVSGFEVARALRESEHTADIPILVLTAKDLTTEDRTRLKGDVNAMLTKSSFSPHDLIAEVHRALPGRAKEAKETKD